LVSEMIQHTAWFKYPMTALPLKAIIHIHDLNSRKKITPRFGGGAAVILPATERAAYMFNVLNHWFLRSKHLEHW
jgi:hypothetical protein